MVDDNQKVVDLQSRRGGGAAHAIPVPLQALKDKAEFFLTGKLNQLLDDVDDALFEFADEASNAKSQHLFFDSMREIRIHRQDIEARFKQALDESFGRSTSGQVLSSLESGHAKLQLLESDALEELVAIEAMGKKAERYHIREIWTLSAAWQQLVGGEVISAASLPLGPQKLAKAMGDACHGLKIDIKARLVVFKLFESQVLDKYDELFQLLTPVLEAQGLKLDSLQSKGKASDGRSDSDLERAKERVAIELTTRVIDAIDALLESCIGGAAGGQVLSKPSFLVALQDIQQAQFSHFTSPTAANESDYGLESISQQLLGRLQQIGRVGSGDASALSAERDASTISFVGTLFQYMLDGDGLSEPLKELVARLQIPILKTAMLDKSFFSHEEHPARKLLSALVSAGIGWTPVGALDKDPLYRKVEAVVMEVLGGFKVDTQIFIDVLQEFGKFQEKAQRRAELMAQRTVDAEGGKATAQAARARIASILDDKLSVDQVPPVVQKLLRDGWAKVMFLSFVQSGEDSPRFQDDVQFVDRLLWSVTPTDDPGYRSELIASLPMIIETLRLGFNRVSLNPLETKQWFEQLERLHLSRLSRKNDSATVRAKVPEQAASPEDELASLDASLADLDQKDAPVRHSMPLPGAEDTTETAPASPQGEISLESLRVGNWVDFRQTDGKMMRCRLAAVINGIGKYIFVNRAGLKVAEFNKDGLRAALQDASVVVIDDDKLFDRALESVISNLRDMKDKPVD